MIDRSKYDEAIESYKAAWLEHGRLVIEFDEAKRSTMRELKEAGKLLSFEIEEEANQLLSRMTDGRMHVRLKSQRETLKGKTIETLDIEVSDELGPRSYDLFSGGEAFRINFAIRIALSKLLARRAGARLQTLIIDEGFGTQDSQGRERLVQAINSVQEDFARILVITHIEELKDAFPVRIDVFKTPEGSQIAIR